MNKNKKWTRNCPICNKELSHTLKHNRDRQEILKRSCACCSHKEVCSRPEYKQTLDKFIEKYATYQI